MGNLVVLFVHLVVTMARLTRPGGIRSVLAESILINHQLQILNRNRKRAPSLRSLDRIIVGFSPLFIRRARLLRSAVTLKPSTLLHLHDLLRKRKYRLLFSSKVRRRPGLKGPSKELITAVVEMKRRNPRWGCPRIALCIAIIPSADNTLTLKAIEADNLRTMPDFLLCFVRFIRLLLHGHQAIALENAVLRVQIAAFHRK